MEQIEDMYSLLDQLERPAFFAKDGCVLRANDAAERCRIEAGTPIESLLLTGQQEYSQYKCGRLHLMLRLPGENRGATISRIGQLDLFTLEHAEENAQLQAMALAAQELRQPLTGIMTVAGRLFPIAGSESDPALQEQIARINRGLFQMLRVVGNMSDAYRYSRDSATSMQTRDISALIRELLQNSAPLVSYAGVELRYTGLNEPVFGLVDAEKLERGISNILSNAVKFSPKGGCIDVKLTRKGNMLHLTVCDSGDGLDEKLQASVYHRFTRDPAIEGSGHGIGLGMVLVRAAAAVHGGTVLIDGANGTRITMTIAIRQEAEGVVRSNRLLVDYAGEWDHRLIELSDVLPAEAFLKETIL